MSACPSVLVSPFIRGPAPYRVERYRERAKSLRGMVDDFVAQEWRDILLRLADSYEALADTTEDDEA